MWTRYWQLILRKINMINCKINKGGGRGFKTFFFRQKIFAQKQIIYYDSQIHTHGFVIIFLLQMQVRPPVP